MGSIPITRSKHKNALEIVMEISINGEATTLPEPTSVHQLLEQKDLLNQRLAIEINMEIIPRGDFAEYIIQAGDEVEIVQAIGGG